MKAIKLLGCFVGLAFAAFLVVDTVSGVNKGGSAEREGIERIKAAQAEADRIQN